MEAVISSLLNRFEKGALTRRELIQGLAMLSATSSGLAAGVLQTGPLKATKIDHVSIQVNDLPRSIAFYQNIFGFTVLSEDKADWIVRLGSGQVLVSLHPKSPSGVVDHFAIGVENFNRESVTRELKQRGVNAEENLDAGFHVKDPERDQRSDC